MRLAVEMTGALIVGLGFLVALWNLAVGVRDRKHDFLSVRLTFARYLVLALEFQLAADILSTAIAPTWDRIGKLAAVAVIRTTLNYFLGNEIRHEEEFRKAESS
jgi:uncharacterized membrane protein